MNAIACARQILAPPANRASRVGDRVLVATRVQLAYRAPRCRRVVRALEAKAEAAGRLAAEVPAAEVPAAEAAAEHRAACRPVANVSQTRAHLASISFRLTIQ